MQIRRHRDNTRAGKRTKESRDDGQRNNRNPRAHIANGHTAKPKNIVNIMASKEDLLFQSLTEVKHERAERWC